MASRLYNARSYYKGSSRHLWYAKTLKEARELVEGAARLGERPGEAADALECSPMLAEHRTRHYYVKQDGEWRKVGYETFLIFLDYGDIYAIPTY